MIEISAGETLGYGLVFSGEQKRALKELEYSIFCIDGHSINSLKQSGVSFWSEWHLNHAIEKEVARISEVAISLDRPFILNSSGKPVFDQLQDVEKFSQVISKQIPGVCAVMGSAFDYLTLGVEYKRKTGISLYRPTIAYDYAATNTSWHGHPLFVGEFYEGSMVVSYRYGNEGYNDIKAMPLIIPAD